MNRDLSLLPQSLVIDFDFQGNIGNPLIVSSLVVLSLAEVAINNDDLDYWNIDNRLNKHRTVKDFDAHVQKMLLELGKVGSMTASVINSSSNNYHFVEFNDSVNGACIRVLHTFTPSANYMKKYLNKNKNIENPQFAYIQYSLDKSKTKVRGVKAVIPNVVGERYISCDLFQAFYSVKHSIGKIKREDVNRMLRQLKNEVSGNISTGEMNAIEEGVEKNV